jgi:chemotaxis protein MotB
LSAQTRHRRRQGLDIWPGFVDALATLVMVIVFVLMIFTLFQFHLKDLITGRDLALERLSQRIGDLADQLAIERRAGADLRTQIGTLGAELAATTTIRDRLQAELAAAREQAAGLVTRLSTREAEASALAAQLASRDADAKALAERLAAAEGDTALSRREIAVLLERLAASEARATAGASTAEDLARRLRTAEAALSDAEGRFATRERDAAGLAQRLATAETALSAAEGRIALREREAAELVRRLAAAEARSREADARLADAFKTVEADREKIEVQLRELDALRSNIRALTLLRDQLERDLSARDAALRGSETALASERRLSADAQFRVDRLTVEIETLRQQLARIGNALDLSEAKSRDQEVQIVDLGRRLNLALASKIEELARYRSEFFGRLREVLGDRGDVRVVGDRFIFETEILFRTGSAELEPEGRRQIDRVAGELAKLARQIPPEINWILQVDGHTDRRPFARGFASNWELSHARAMSVVRAMMAGGVPPERLVAAGYAEFQPVDPRDDDAGYRRNRRIELKLTAR